MSELRLSDFETYGKGGTRVVALHGEGTDQTQTAHSGMRDLVIGNLRKWHLKQHHLEGVPKSSRARDEFLEEVNR